MLKYATDSQRNYFKQYCEEINDEYCFSDDEADIPTFHFVIEDLYGVYLGYIAYHIKNNKLIGIELVAKQPSRLFMKGFLNSLYKISIIVNGFSLTSYKESPSHKMLTKIMKNYNFTLRDYKDYQVYENNGNVLKYPINKGGFMLWQPKKKIKV